MDKETIRSQLLSARERMSPAEVRDKSRQIQRTLTDHVCILKATKVALYSDIRNEVATGEAFDRLKKAGKELFFPRMVPDGLEFVHVEKLSELIPGRWGVLEPCGEDLAVTQSLEVIVVPGIAFDEEGYRIGFGKGYYDRALKSFQGSIVGLAYDFQVKGKIPHHRGDCRCSLVISEKRVIQRAEALWHRS